MNRPATPCRLMARSEEWDALERRPRRDYGREPSGTPQTNYKALVDRPDRDVDLYMHGMRLEAKRSTTARLLERMRSGLEEVVREEVVEKGRSLDFDRQLEIDKLVAASVEALRGVLKAHLGDEVEVAGQDEEEVEEA